MFLQEHLEDYVSQYCELKGIHPFEGRIPARHEKDVMNFVRNKLKTDRAITRKKEDYDNSRISNIVRKVCDLVNPMESPIEEYMYQAIINHKLDEHCSTQFKIGTKRVDFAFPIANLVVECDGKEYHHTDQLQIERDQQRDKYLARKGWRVLHFEGVAIRRNIDLCMEKIIKNLEPFLKGLKK